MATLVVENSTGSSPTAKSEVISVLRFISVEATDVDAAAERRLPDDEGEKNPASMTFDTPVTTEDAAVVDMVPRLDADALTR